MINDESYSTEEIIKIAKKRLFLPSRFINQMANLMTEHWKGKEYSCCKIEDGLIYFTYIGNDQWLMRET